MVFLSEFGLFIFGILFLLLYNDLVPTIYLLLHIFIVLRGGWMDVLGEFLLYIDTVLYNCNHVCVFLHRTSRAKGRER